MKKFAWQSLFDFGFVWDNEGGDGGEGGEGGDGGEEGGDTSYTKAEVQKMLEQQRTQQADKIKQLEEQLSKVTTSTQKSEEERQTLLKQLGQLRKENMSKEELAREEQAKQASDFEKQLNAQTEKANHWERAFQNLYIDNAILSAVGDKAFNTDQFLQIVKPTAEFAPVVGEDGKETGNYEVKMKIDDLVLPVPDAIKRMEEQPEKFGNLFKSGVVKGMGHRGGRSEGMSIDALKSSDQSTYEKHRKDLGLS